MMDWTRAGTWKLGGGIGGGTFHGMKGKGGKRKGGGAALGPGVAPRKACGVIPGPACPIVSVAAADPAAGGTCCCCGAPPPAMML